MAKLVLIRHGISEYNEKGMWTGWDNPGLMPKGFEQARKAGEEIKDIKFDTAYTADLLRARQTLDEVLKAIGQENIPVITAPETKERHYGIFTKKNKWQVKEEVGEEEFQKIRRSWDYQPKEGESLKQVNERFWKYYQEEILPKLKQGKNIVITSSGNAFRALIKSLENLTEDEIAKLEFGIGEAYVYDINSEGKITRKEIRNKNPLAGKQ
jgi:2,3-bisphosphoglycerate-dependent phosphoglycerate mutase